MAACPAGNGRRQKLRSGAKRQSAGRIEKTPCAFSCPLDRCGLVGFARKIEAENFSGNRAKSCFAQTGVLNAPRPFKCASESSGQAFGSGHWTKPLAAIHLRKMRRQPTKPDRRRANSGDCKQIRTAERRLAPAGHICGKTAHRGFPSIAKAEGNICKSRRISLNFFQKYSLNLPKIFASQTDGTAAQ